MFRWRKRSSSEEEEEEKIKLEAAGWNYVTMGVCLKLGSKSDFFLRDGNTWLCSTGLPSDVIIKVGDTSFRLHKFPLLSRSGVLEKLIEQSRPQPEVGTRHCIIHLHDIPGGAKTFLLVVKFCYGVRFELNSSNIVSLRCAAEFFQMTDDFGDKNLVVQTELFLEAALGNWVDTLSMLESCQDQQDQHNLLSWAEKLHIVSRCIESLASKACAEFTAIDRTKSSLPTTTSSNDSHQFEPRPIHDWWHEDVAHLKLPFYRRLIRACESKGMKAESVAGSVIYYAKKYLPMTARHTWFKPETDSSSGSSSSSTPGSVAVNPPLFDPDQRYLLEEIVDLLPQQTGVVPSKFLLTLLRIAMILHASPSCQENLEKRVGAQLDQASLEDLLIPNLGYSAETLYDTDCVQRIVDHFLAGEKDAHRNSHTVCYSDEYIQYSNICYEGAGDAGGSNSVTRASKVANLIDGYLAEVATDVNLKLPKFQSLAGAVPDYGRVLDDWMYRAIDIYLKAHPWLTDQEREQVCRLMNFQKLSLEASTHAAQNQRLPLRAVVQILFFEQLRLRTSIAGCLLVSENVDNTNNRSHNLLGCCSAQLDSTRFHSSRYHNHEQVQQILTVDDEMRAKVTELEKECLSIKRDLERIVNNKSSWNLVMKKFGGLSLKSMSTDEKRKGAAKPATVAAEPSNLPLPSVPVKFVHHSDIKGEWFE